MSYFFLGADPTFSVLTFLLNVVCLVISGAGCVLLWTRREIFPLTGRHHLMDVGFNLFAFISRLTLCWRFLLPSGRPCVLYNWDTFINITGMALMMVLRAWYLLFKGEITRNIKVQENPQKVGVRGHNPEGKGWYLRNRHMISTPWLLKFVAIYYAIVIVFGVITNISDPASVTAFDPCPDNGLISYVASIWLIIDLLIVCFLACKIRPLECDAFNIQKEMKVVGIFTITALIIWQVETALLTPDQQNYWLTSSIDNCIIIFVDLILVTVIPLAASYRRGPTIYQSVATTPPRKSNGKSYRNSTLDEVLLNPGGYKDFFHFLAKEWSTENLLFWKEVNYYKTLADPEERTRYAQLIYETYIRENAFYQVNLPDFIRQSVRDDIAQTLNPDSYANADLFDKAQLEIFNLMNTDSFLRFNRTDESLMELSEVQPSEQSVLSVAGSHGNEGSKNNSRAGSYADAKDLSPRLPVSSLAEKIEEEGLNQSVDEENGDEQFVM